MLHVRLVSPESRTGQVAEVLSAASGVRNVVIEAGAAHRPDGDAVRFDVHDDAANAVLATLHHIGLYRSGGICVDRVDASLRERSAHRGHRGALRRETAPVWEMVDAVIRAGQSYVPSFYILLVTAGLIATVGLVTNSQVLIVAAMVVGPEYNAIMGVAAGFSRRDADAIRDGLFALLWGFLAAIVASLVFGLALRASGKTPAPFLVGVRPVADFINSPDVFSVIVAVLAGVAGVVSLTQARANALIGVFISITTIPAAASLGVSMAYLSWGEAAGSALQLLVNVVLLIVVGAAGLTTQRRIWRRHALGPAGGRPFQRFGRAGHGRARPSPASDDGERRRAADTPHHNERRRVMATSPTYGERRETSGWTGWVAFAGVMLLLLGLASAIEGLTAVFDQQQYEVAPSALVVADDYQAWGWLHFGMGVLACLIGLGVLAGNRIARVAAAVIAGLSAIVHLAFLPAAPLLVVILVAIDLIVIYAIVAHGDEMPSSR